MKKIVKGKQCNIICHFDNLNMSLVDFNIVSSVIADIESEYGKVEKMTIMNVKIHRYVGVIIEYPSPGKVILSMAQYIGKIIYGIPEDMRGE